MFNLALIVDYLVITIVPALVIAAAGILLIRVAMKLVDKLLENSKLEKAAEGRFSPLNYCSKEKIEEEIKALKEAGSIHG